MLLKKEVLEKIIMDIQAKFIYSNNAIEGSSLGLDKVHRIIESGHDFLAKSPYYQHLTINQCNAFGYIKRKARNSITVKDVLELHNIIMKNIQRETGCFRDHDTRNSIQKNIGDFLDTLSLSEEYHTIEKSAIIQGYFHQVRPFNYGTGIIARLLAKWVLNQHGYLLGIDLNKHEIKYYRKCSERAGKGILYPLVNMMSTCVEDTLDHLLVKIRSHNIIPIEDAMRINHLDRSQMIEGIRRGEFKAYRKNGSIYVVNKATEEISHGAQILELII
ncbi:hypothetical protein GF326_01000 [Candidatus Bathyarchaeota archaeon]|nr:hypothetical protein [Candidatus Bathyarchaeota archaeon]